MVQLRDLSLLISRTVGFNVSKDGLPPQNDLHVDESFAFLQTAMHLRAGRATVDSFTVTGEPRDIHTRDDASLGHTYSSTNAMKRGRLQTTDSVVLAQDDRMGFHICIVGY